MPSAFEPFATRQVVVAATPVSTGVPCRKRDIGAMSWVGGVVVIAASPVPEPPPRYSSVVAPAQSGPAPPTASHEGIGAAKICVVYGADWAPSFGPTSSRVTRPIVSDPVKLGSAAAAPAPTRPLPPRRTWRRQVSSSSMHPCAFVIVGTRAFPARSARAGYQFVL